MWFLLNDKYYICIVKFEPVRIASTGLRPRPGLSQGYPPSKFAQYQITIELNKIKNSETFN